MHCEQLTRQCKHAKQEARLGLHKPCKRERHAHCPDKAEGPQQQAVSTYLWHRNNVTSQDYAPSTSQDYAMNMPPVLPLLPVGGQLQMCSMQSLTSLTRTRRLKVRATGVKVTG